MAEIVYYSFIVSTVEDDTFPRTTILHATINDTTTFQGCLDFIVYLFIFSAIWLCKSNKRYKPDN